MNPYYETYMREFSFCPFLPWEDQKEADKRRMQELYPTLARQIMPLVEETCDRLEYDGSFMFDVYPDRFYLFRLVNQIYETLDKRQFLSDLEVQTVESGQNWLKDFISVLLLNEMYRRRCRRNDRRGNRLY